MTILNDFPEKFSMTVSLNKQRVFAIFQTIGFFNSFKTHICLTQSNKLIINNIFWTLLSNTEILFIIFFFKIFNYQKKKRDNIRIYHNKLLTFRKADLLYSFKHHVIPYIKVYKIRWASLTNWITALFFF